MRMIYRCWSQTTVLCRSSKNVSVSVNAETPKPARKSCSGTAVPIAAQGRYSQLSGAGLLRGRALCRFHRDRDRLCFCRAVGLLQLDDHLIRPGVALVRLIKD